MNGQESPNRSHKLEEERGEETREESGGIINITIGEQASVLISIIKLTSR